MQNHFKRRLKEKLHRLEEDIQVEELRFVAHLSSPRISVVVSGRCFVTQEMSISSCQENQASNKVGLVSRKTTTVALKAMTE